MAVFLYYFSMVLAKNIPCIRGGRYNADKKAIEINIHYGGCNQHKFKLHIGICRQSSPVQCDAKLIDLMTTDDCEMIILDKVLITLHEAGLDTDYYKGASIMIQGDDDSKVLITLPGLYLSPTSFLGRLLNFFFPFFYRP
jgi:hypothetical protein